MNQSQCGYCYQPDCAECFPPHVKKEWEHTVRVVPGDEKYSFEDRKVGKIHFHETLPRENLWELPNQEALVMVPLNAITDKTSLRDQIAIAALQGLLSHPVSSSMYPIVASQAYELADAMLKAREK